MKSIDHNTVLLIKVDTPFQLNIIYAWRYTDSRKDSGKLILLEKSNFKADKIISLKARPPIPTHILNTPIAVYKKTYHPNKFDLAVWSIVEENMQRSSRWINIKKLKCLFISILSYD